MMSSVYFAKYITQKPHPVQHSTGKGISIIKIYEYAEIDYANLLSTAHAFNIIRVIKKYIYMDRTHIDIYIQLLLLPTGHLSTSRTPPHTHFHHRIHQSLKITFLPATPRITIREKYISVK